MPQIDFTLPPDRALETGRKASASIAQDWADGTGWLYKKIMGSDPSGALPNSTIVIPHNHEQRNRAGETDLGRPLAVVTNFPRGVIAADTDIAGRVDYSPVPMYFPSAPTFGHELPDGQVLWSAYLAYGTPLRLRYPMGRYLRTCVWAYRKTGSGAIALRLLPVFGDAIALLPATDNAVAVTAGAYTRHELVCDLQDVRELQGMMYRDAPFDLRAGVYASVAASTELRIGDPAGDGPCALAWAGG